MKKAIFLDRDGVILDDEGYMSRPEQIKFITGVPEALRTFINAGFELFIVTNQSGIGRGYFTESEYLAFHQAMIAGLRSQNIEIRDTKYCPHLPDADCACRKPNPGMILDLLAHYQIDPAESFMIGDRKSDIDAGIAAGVRSVQIAIPGVQKEKDLHPHAAGYAENLLHASKYILALS